MSTWTHICTSFCFDYWGDEPLEIHEFIGSERSEKSSPKDHYIPEGTEGTAQYSITKYLKDDHRYNISVYGDLRDYTGWNNIYDLIYWFTETCTRLNARGNLRQAVGTFMIDDMNVTTITCRRNSVGECTYNIDPIYRKD